MPETEAPPAAGHNSGAFVVAVDRLRSLVERVERIEEEKKGLSADVRDIYAEAKSAGYDPQVLRKLIALRKQEPAKLQEQEAVLDTYRAALSM